MKKMKPLPLPSVLVDIVSSYVGFAQLMEDIRRVKDSPWLITVRPRVVKYHPEIILAAVTQDPRLLAHVGQTYELCMAVVKKNGMALQFINQEIDFLGFVDVDVLVERYMSRIREIRCICLAAVKQNGYALAHVNKSTSKIRRAARRSIKLLSSQSRLCRLRLKLEEKLDLFL
jgi:ABC-type uncharacterized transport system fused permease/ATPase subunit